MTRLINLLKRIASWKTLLPLLALYFFFNGYLLNNAEKRMNELAGSEVGVIDLTFGFNPQKTLDMVAAYGDEGRAYYARTELTTDIAYPVIYAFLFGIILMLLYKNTRLEKISALPFLTMLFDFAENATIVTLLNSHPNVSGMVANLCEVFKLLKWGSIMIMLLLILGGLISLIFRRKAAKA
ncbi:MAG: hypothetical protein H6581_31365 [Bacteroidia bacterium]|nr:hypothetical protein [Bacteroidia bacterium]